jgi:hypothetical protein
VNPFYLFSSGLLFRFIVYPADNSAVKVKDWSMDQVIEWLATLGLTMVQLTIPPHPAPLSTPL